MALPSIILIKYYIKQEREGVLAAARAVRREVLRGRRAQPQLGGRL